MPWRSRCRRRRFRASSFCCSGWSTPPYGLRKPTTTSVTPLSSRRLQPSTVKPSIEITWISKGFPLGAVLAAQLLDAGDGAVQVGRLTAASVHPAVAHARRAAQRRVGVPADQDRQAARWAPGLILRLGMS